MNIRAILDILRGNISSSSLLFYTMEKVNAINVNIYSLLLIAGKVVQGPGAGGEAGREYLWDRRVIFPLQEGHGS